MARRDKHKANVIAGQVTAEDIRLEDAQGDNAYAQQMSQNHKSEHGARVIVVISVIAVAIFLFALITPKDILNQAVHYGGYNSTYSFSWFVEDLQTNVTNLMALLTGSQGADSIAMSNVLLYIVIALTGAGMAMCGCVYQGTFKNALVTPSALGVISGSMLGMTFFVVLFVRDDDSGFSGLKDIFRGSGATDTMTYIWGSYGLAICSFVGCMLIVGLVLLTMNVFNKGKLNGLMMIITGQVIGAVCGGIVNVVRYYFIYIEPEGAQATVMQEIQISSFYRDFTWIDVVAVGIPLIATFIVIMCLRNKMGLLTLSEEEAISLGTNTKAVRVVLVALCTLTTAIIVSFCGHIGFVGFLVPHMARRLVGPNFKYLIPATMALGSAFVMAAFLIVQMTLGPEYETVAGVFISIFGAVIFLFTAIRGGGSVNGEFK